jgi:transposase
MDSSDRRIIELEKQVAKLKELLQAALDEVARLKKNSSNSSKPPSSDIVKPTKDKDRRRKKKIGAQQGHPQHLREPFSEEQVDQTVELQLDACPKCGGKLQPTNEPPKKHQQVELVDMSIDYWMRSVICFRRFIVKMIFKPGIGSVG